MTSFYNPAPKFLGPHDQSTQETEVSALPDLPIPMPQAKPELIPNDKKSQSSFLYAKGKAPSRINSHRHSVSTNKVSTLNITQEDAGHKSNISTFRNSITGHEGDPTIRKNSMSGIPLSARTHHAHKKSMANLSTRPGSGNTTHRSPPKGNLRKSMESNATLRPSSVNAGQLKWSERAQSRILQEKNTHKESIRRGTEGLDSLLSRKALEKQVEQLEVRLNKLRFEEENMAKKIRDTTEKTEKIMEAKKRHQDDLILKEWRARRKEQELHRLRNDVRRDREESQNGLKNSMMDNFKNKHTIAYSVKMVNDHQKKLKERIKAKRDARNEEIHEEFYEGGNMVMADRQNKENERQKDVTEKYEERINFDKLKADELNNKCKELELIENEMLQRLNQTYSMHQTKILELEKAFSLKVNINNQIGQ